jgi:hypothetical protein
MSEVPLYVLITPVALLVGAPTPLRVGELAPRTTLGLCLGAYMATLGAVRLLNHYFKLLVGAGARGGVGAIKVGEVLP